MSNTTFVLVRHGETNWNQAERLQGQVNSLLNDNGRRQARELAVHLNSVKPDALYSSDLLRAVDTVAAIESASGVPAVLDARLRERDCGVLQGLSTEQAKACQAHVYAGYLSSDPDYTPPNGESPALVKIRVLDFLEEKLRSHSGQTVAIVTHGGLIHILINYCQGLCIAGPRSEQLTNASISTIVFSNARWQVFDVGFTAHLSDALGLDNLG